VYQSDPAMHGDPEVMALGIAMISPAADLVVSTAQCLTSGCDPVLYSMAALPGPSPSVIDNAFDDVAKVADDLPITPPPLPNSLDELLAESIHQNPGSSVGYNNTRTEAFDVFENLAKDYGPHPSQKPGYYGEYKGGGYIGYRPWSSSGQVTLDFHKVPGYPKRIEVKFPNALPR